MRGLTGSGIFVRIDDFGGDVGHSKAGAALSNANDDMTNAFPDDVNV